MEKWAITTVSNLGAMPMPYERAEKSDKNALRATPQAHFSKQQEKRAKIH